jgi:hypothetical protein
VNVEGDVRSGEENVLRAGIVRYEEVQIWTTVLKKIWLLYDIFRLQIFGVYHLSRHMKYIMFFYSLPEHFAIEVISAT